MKKVVVSAPGKLHLSGEHAVVYGKPALITSVSQRLTIKLQVRSSKFPSTSLRAGEVRSDISKIRLKDKYINEIVKLVEKRYDVQIREINLEIKSEIPVGAGMGSSAALAVSLIGALVTWLNKPWDLGMINELAYQAEKFKYVNSSGSDPTISTYGGLLWYRKELDFLKSFLVLSFKIPKSFVPFVLVATGRQETTGDLVSAVAKLKQRKPQIVDELLNNIEQVTKDITQAIHDEDEKKMRSLIKENEKLLEKLGVVSDMVKNFLEKLADLGGVGKITGAGGRKKGSGIVICSHADSGTIERLAKKYDFPYFKTELGGKGVRLEQVIM